ncbi:hypothetical protein QN277_001944 [Acacia crassicarpa]|uniref:R13L1/DRL21-like LRR repeat region domain-containing protein n=1 Tax=Acacia crassicarpa TaxID=499986 RepID=A0AAE1N9T7_9FABA|nr:hypothetical protein QN277_001944 [Acacia crassicarpa]
MNASEANLKEKKYLEDLSFQWNANKNDDSKNERDVLEKLRPHPNLKRLSIKYYNGTRFPDWFADTTLSNIVALRLQSCKYCSGLPSLGLLPSLKSLTIEGLDYIVVIGAELSSGSLESLELVRMVNWEEWDCINASSAFPSLKELRIRNCPKLKETLPQQLASLGPSLKSLAIEGLDGIVAIGAELSSGSLEFLEFVRMVNWEEWDCTNALSAFPSLKELRIRNCPKLKETLPQQLPSLGDLVIQDCPQLVALIPWAPTIRTLTLTNCEKVQLECAPASLKVLRFGGPCTNASMLEKIEHSINNNCIEEVEIYDCPNLKFPLSQQHDSLCKIWIKRSCGSLRSFPLDLFPALDLLSLHGCDNLEMIDVSEGCNHVPTSLTSLAINQCPNFISFSEGEFSSLRECYLAHLGNLKSLPEPMNTFVPSLHTLEIWNCPQLEPFPEGSLPSKLRRLSIVNCPKLFACRMKWGLHNLGFLHSFEISGDDAVESLLEPGLLPTCLTYLSIIRCSNLKMLDYKALCQFPSLKELNLRDCPRLQCLPKEGLPSSLSYLSITGDCPELKQRCQKLKGEDWPKIAHIPCLWIS